jgi:hypothetical protein
VRLGGLVARLASAAGLSGWVDYYRRLLGAALEPMRLGALPSSPSLREALPDSLS